MSEIFTQKLRVVMITHRDIGHSLPLNNVQIVQVWSYQNANNLLFDCLQLAIVSDRARIENSLWLPPGERVARPAMNRRAI